MKISLVCPHVEHAFTGETSSLEALKICLEKSGITCRIVVPPLGPALAGQENAWKRLQRMRSILHGLPSEPDPPDLYHIFLPTPSLSWVLPRSLPARALVTFEGLLIGEEWRTLLKLMPAAPMYSAVRLLINNSLVARIGRSPWPVTVASERQKRDIVAIGYSADRVHVMPNIVRPNFLGYTLERDECVRILGLDPARRYVTYLGHFMPSKGVEELVAAYDGICRRHADVDLLLAWSGVGEGRGIERLIAEKGMCHRVKVLGALDPRVVLRASHLAVFPYRTLHGHSLLPSAIIEALAIGTPVLVPRHAIFSALDGLLHFCSNTSSEELERCIDEIISGRTSVMKGVELETAYRARMDPATLGGQMIQLYESAINA